jgi:sterol desaturase/sphingolipid hydroxylase (fatty acid hydroxylase superfamily)
MPELIPIFWHATQITFLWLCAFGIIFSVLAYFVPCNPDQPLWRKDILTDIAYAFIIPILGRFARVAFIGIAIFLLFHNTSQQTLHSYLLNGFGPLQAWPLWLQAAVIFLLSDIYLYWSHRLWRFHAIHHSSTHIDWLSTYRFHPINTWLSFTLLDTLILLSGFSPEATVLMGSFNVIYSAMVHANLNWTFGPFKHVFSSPVFHRWHHTAQAEGMNKNFAATFPLLDIAFGTFYMPEGRVPESYGVDGLDIGRGFIAHTMSPFKKAPSPLQ